MPFNLCCCDHICPLRLSNSHLCRYSNYFFKGVFGVVAILTIIFTGLGTAAKYTIEEAKRAEAADGHAEKRLEAGAQKQTVPPPVNTTAKVLPDDDSHVQSFSV